LKSIDGTVLNGGPKGTRTDTLELEGEGLLKGFTFRAV